MNITNSNHRTGKISHHEINSRKTEVHLFKISNNLKPESFVVTQTGSLIRIEQ